jgi:phosphoglycerate dehydrogenase-like enzyme
MAQEDDPYLPMLDSVRSRARVVTGPKADSLAPEAANAEALLAWSPNKREIAALLPRAPKLQWMHSRWAGLDSLLFPELVEHPVTLTNSRGVYSQSLGEFVITGALYFAKNIPRLLSAKAAKNWEPFTVVELRGATMGIVGYGDIGKACAQRAHALGMRVLASRRRPSLSDSDPFVDLVFPPEGVIEMIRECDYVVSAAPLTAYTYHMISDAELAAMKPTAVVMNVGRGPVIDEAALVRALQSRRIQGAALDVFEVEPLAADSPLWSLPNILISPHCADNTPTWHEESMQFFLDNFERFEKGESLKNVVDKNAGY